MNSTCVHCGCEIDFDPITGQWNDRGKVMAEVCIASDQHPPHHQPKDLGDFETMRQRGKRIARQVLSR